MNKIVLVVLAGVCSLSLLAKENVGTNNTTSNSSLARVASDCTPSEAMTDLNINNVRATILGASDMWWNLSSGKYEIPKNGDKHSLFAGALWIAGIDAGDQLKAAAMTYRQTGNDFWTGPLDISSNIDAATCDDYDKHFQITRQEVDDFIAWYNDKAAFPNYAIPLSIIEWPANGIIGGDSYQFLAPYEDVNGDGEYNPEEDGDYPKYDLSGNADCSEEDLIYGDQTLFWVFNDKGNIHSETGADPIGLEIRAQAFAFATNDEINNMTFYNYTIINKATIQLNDAYFGQWVDPDLGNFEDDYVGCDVARGFGYCYNGDDDDEGASGYGLNPPAIGVDFFQGPLADLEDGVDNDRDSIIDEPGEQCIMSRFVYYNNQNDVPDGNPDGGQHFYNYLLGKWGDGLDITYGEDGRGGSVKADFMFPGDSDPYGWGTDGVITEADWDDSRGWTEETAGNEAADRRFIQSAGPFTLAPGAVNKITTGVVWARAISGGAFASVELARIADDKAQALFDNCFNVLNGPDAPDVEIVELDRQLAFNFSNSPSSNNFLEQYLEFDPLIISPPGQTWDPYFRFQGYQLYQLVSQSVSATDLNNPDLARLVFQTDLKDDVVDLVNYSFDVTIQANVPTQEVAGSNLGISHNISITEDEFATGNKTLVNNKTYYFMAVAYGYNQYKAYDPTNPELLDGQQQPYKAGRKNIKVYSAIPHKPFTTVLNAEIGEGIQITKVLGAGNGASELSLVAETEDAILSSETAKVDEVTYEAGKGPVDVQVIDPYRLTQANFALKLYGDIYDLNIESGEVDPLIIDPQKSRWELVNLDTDESYLSDATIEFGNQQLFPDLGFSIEVLQVNPPEFNYALDTEDFENNNGFISSSITYEDEFKPWLGGVSDRDEEDGAVTVDNTNFWGQNWIHAGTYKVDNSNESAFDDFDGDPDAVFETVVNGTWAPYRFVSFYKDGPGYDQNKNYTSWVFQQENNEIKELQSIKVVYTDDKSKWSRCVVLESQDNPQLAYGNAEKMDKRASFSVDKYGVADESSTGLGWFPGYAINKETGERLNIMFSEDSWLQTDNGRDMMWNPTSRLTTDVPTFFNGSYFLGGKHFVYVHSSLYDECHAADSILSISNNLVPKRKFFKDMMWVNVPLLNVGYDFPLFDEEGQDVTVNIDVSREYRGYESVDLTEYTEIINLPSSINRVPLKDLMSEYDQLFAYDVEVSLMADSFYVYVNDTLIDGIDTTFSIVDSTYVIDVIDSLLVDDTWRQADDLDDVYYTSTVAGGSESAALEITYRKVNYPSYRFNTAGLIPTVVTSETAEDSVMNLINIVPNPYYAYSEYESNQLDNRVRIINLPVECTISIYSLNGSLVKRIEKDSEGSASIDWDLKNQKGIPIASGAYIVNVYVPSLGKEKNLKWFGVMRPIDLDTF